MRVLTIDGGGIRGVIPAMVLAEIEKQTDGPVHEHFDLIAGTSTGGIIACATTKPQPQTAQQLVELYVQEGPKIFHRDLIKRITSLDGWIDERYDDSGLNTALKQHLGEARVHEALTPIMVTAYDIQGRRADFFRSDSGQDVLMWEAARSSSAAPTYFEPWRIGGATYVDGGVFATNPAMCAYADIPEGEKIDLWVSLGTGSKTADHAIPYDEAKSWGQLGWARPILDVVFDGVADTVEFELGKFVPPADYYRLQPKLEQASGALDDASEENLKALEADGKALLTAEAARITELCQRLTTDA